MSGYAETVLPYDDSKDNIWQRIRRPLAQGLMQRGTPGGLLLGALLGSFRTPGDDIAHQNNLAMNDLALQERRARLGNLNSETADRNQQTAAGSLKTLAETQAYANNLASQGRTPNQISGILPGAKSIDEQVPALPGMNDDAGKPIMPTPYDPLSSGSGSYASLFPSLNPLTRTATKYPRITPPEHKVIGNSVEGYASVVLGPDGRPSISPLLPPRPEMHVVNGQLISVSRDDLGNPVSTPLTDAVDKYGKDKVADAYKAQMAADAKELTALHSQQARMAGNKPIELNGKSYPNSSNPALNARLEQVEKRAEATRAEYMKYVFGGNQKQAPADASAPAPVAKPKTFPPTSAATPGAIDDSTALTPAQGAAYLAARQAGKSKEDAYKTAVGK